LEPNAIEALVNGVLAFERRSIGKAITEIETGGETARAFLSAIHPRIGSARRLGITGPPGAGKSTLVAFLVKAYRGGSQRVGVVAVDPTSPYSGGALLGDRVRMSALTTDPGVFIRSMASRGAFGGLARATWDAVDVLDAAGCDPVVIETVGVGQTEVEIAGLADTTIVVLSPEVGDNVQAMKAGLMEIADIFVVNKADRNGAEALARDITAILGLRDVGAGGDAWRPPVLLAVAQRGEGVDAVIDAAGRHADHLRNRGLLEKRRRSAIRRRILDILEHEIRLRFWTEEAKRALDGEVERVYRKEADPTGAARRLLDGASP
jgi:LAO/AO transport system kinase